MYGVIDIGSNTVRLVVYRVEDIHIENVMNKKYMLGLAGYIDADNRLTEDGIGVLIHSLRELQKLLECIVLDELYLFATASLRNIDNTDEVQEEVKKATGWDIDILSGVEEARCGYYGMLYEYNPESGIVADIGGGSTELVFFSDRKILKSRSMPMGSLNLRDRYVEKILPKNKELSQIDAEIKARLRKIRKPQDFYSEVLYAEGGSARAAQKIICEADKKYAGKPRYSVSSLQKFLCFYQTNEDQAIDLFLKICPERIHTIVPGMKILAGVAERYGCKTIVTMKGGVREGYLRRKLFGIGSDLSNKGRRAI